ncbi:PfkB family carbohydrate kinase [Dactylosporangium sp. NPDC051484]|uniref:PfkB family carbohydrate kinase n=1 Tax=Dactylosporangium sp. NPDC051484 TaxID=3154942 RepID=UPI00344E8060
MNGPLVIVGDTILDRDIDGTAHRVSPDAPALVLDEQHTAERPGGAGLAALLAARDGVDVILVTAITDDPAGARLTKLLTTEGIQLCVIPASGHTPEKIRLRADDQVLLRLDRGSTARTLGPLPAAAQRALQAAAGVLVSDYGGGIAQEPAVRAAISTTRAGIVWDPHPRGPAPVPGTRLATPNQHEARHHTGNTTSVSGLAAVIQDGDALRRRWNVQAVAVTIGAAGAVLCQGDPVPLIVPTEPARVRDTRGAGDRFAATAAIALSRGALITEAVEHAVSDATRYVADERCRPQIGNAETTTYVAPNTDLANAQQLADGVRARGGTVAATGGCFDLLHTGHIATLNAARRLGDCLIVCLNSDTSVANLKGPGRPVISQHDRAAMLLALRCVDAVVIFNERTPIPTLNQLRPDIWVKGGDYTATGMSEAQHLQRWGEQAVTVPYLSGRSTTTILTRAHRTNPAGAEPEADGHGRPSAL